MKNLFLFVLLMLSATLFTSCATLFSKKQTVTVTSDVDGASVFVGSKYVGKTPLAFETKKAKATITVQKDGYASQQILTRRKVRSNVWLGYLIGVGPIVDMCSGKWMKYKQTDYFVSLQDPSINERYNQAIIDKQMKWVAPVVAVSSAVLTGAATYASAKQAENAQKAAEKKARLEQQQAELEARMQANTLANRQRMEAKEQMERDRRNAATQNYYNSYEQARSNGNSSRSMETSDLAQHNATRMSDATYGTAVTNQALAQQRQYDAQQNQQVQVQQRQINQQQRQQAQSQQSYPGSAINAVTSTGAHVQIKVYGNQVTAYSSGNNLMGPEWNGVVPAATVQDTSSPISQASSNIASRYAYQASVRGLGMVYWGTPTRRVINDAPNGNPVKAVTQNGQTLTIMVNGNSVVAYASGLNQASDIQWHSILPCANIAETNSSFDGDLSTRFKYKANISGIGTVYF